MIEINNSEIFKNYEISTSTKVLTRKEEFELFLKYKNNGDIDSYNKIIKHNTKLVIAVVHSTVRSYEHFDDFIQEGMIGLNKAIEKFKPELGNKFSTYATCWIKQTVSRYKLNNIETIRWPVYRVEQMLKIEKAKIKLVSEGKKITHEILTKETGLQEKDIYAIEKLQEIKILDAKRGKNNNEDEFYTDFIDSVPNKETPIDTQFIKKQNNKKLIELLLKKTSPKEFYVITRRFGLLDDEATTLQQIANIMGVSRERIRQIQSKCLKKLRKSKEMKELFHLICKT